MTGYQELQRMHLEKQGAFPYPVPYKHKPTSSNGLTRCICDYINYKGGQAERINSTGRMIDNTKIVQDVLGRSIKIGSIDWIKGSGTKGTADISSTIPISINGIVVGVSVKWEVKYAKDRQSEVQREYEEKINLAAGYYFIVRTFEDFYEKYNELIKPKTL